LHERTIRRLAHRLDLPIHRQRGGGCGGQMWLDAGTFLVLLPIITSNRRLLYAPHRQRRTG
jgi:hypothetical protein